MVVVIEFYTTAAVAVTAAVLYNVSIRHSLICQFIALYSVPYCRLLHFCTFLYYASYSLLHIFYFILPSYFLVSCFILSNASLQRFLITTSLSNYTLSTLLFHFLPLFSFSTASPSLLSIQPAACNARKTSIRMECKKITKVDIKHTYN